SRPSVVGITLFTVGVWSAVGIARGLKRALPDVSIVVGGPHISSMGRETMERFADFDFAVVGEGEWALTELLDALEKDGDLAAIAGLMWRDGEDLRVNAAQPSRKELDERTLPA